MKIGVLGTGIVGTTIGTKLISLGHQVKMGSRSAQNEKAVQWASQSGSQASVGIFAEAAAFGDLIFLCTNGSATLDIIRQANPENFAGKVVIDVTNPLGFSGGMPPVLIPELSNTTSLGEELQKALPEAYVIKTLNTMNCTTMVNPGNISGESDVFVCGNDPEAKTQVTDLLRSFGWPNPIDLGDITAARGTEMILPLWLRLYGAFKSPMFNFKIVR